MQVGTAVANTAATTAAQSVMTTQITDMQALMGSMANAMGIGKQPAAAAAPAPPAAEAALALAPPQPSQSQASLPLAAAAARVRSTSRSPRRNAGQEDATMTERPSS